MRAWAGPLALLAVLGVALIVGSGAFDAAPPATAQRIQALERDVKCPTCTNLSVAQSDAPSSIALRRSIAAEVRAGRTDQQILDGVVARYGTQALLVPPGAGATVLWAVPVVLGAGVATAATAGIVRRRRSQ
jgi:cytochrome c-type biogenesis protein CcmH